MAWNDRYGRDYGASWYDRGTGRPGYESWEGGAAPQQGSLSRTGRTNAGSGGNYLGYDWQYRPPPSQSPNYGRDADRNVQRWAREHGYDAGYEIRPRSGGGSRMSAYSGYGGEYRSGIYDRDYHGRYGGASGRSEFFGENRSGRFDMGFGRRSPGAGYARGYDREMGSRSDRWSENRGLWDRSNDYRW